MRQDIVINWDVFRRDEMDIIHKLMQNQRYDLIASALTDVDQIKERELQRVVDKYTDLVIIEDSKVREEMNDAEHKSGGKPVIDSPEKEAEWQAKLDAEKEEQEARALKSKGLNEVKACCGAKGLKHKKNCPEASKV